jgi:hypothetical protein
MSTQAKREALVYHEAGHAVVARLLGVNIAYATMLADTHQAAGVQTRSAAWRAVNAGSDSEAHALGCETDAKVSYAGIVAEQIHKPMSKLKIRRRMDAGWSNDLRAVESILAKAVMVRSGIPIPMEPPGTVKSWQAEPEVRATFTPTPEQRAALEAMNVRVQHEVRQLLQDNWSAVERVAAAFLKQPLFSEEEIDALIAG